MAIDAGYTITPLSGKNGTNGQNGASLSVQYSVDGTSNWHNTFASGDFYMRQKLGNGSWSSAMKIVGEDGKNAITMTSATTPSGEYNGQIGFWQGQPYSWNGSTWVKQIGDLPTDAVLHYSFDDVPDYPDGTAVYFKNKDWTTTDYWTPFANNGTISVENGILTSTRTENLLSSFNKGIGIPANSIIKMVLKDVSDTNVYIYRVTNGSYYNIKTVTLKANVSQEVILSVSVASQGLMIRNAENVGAGYMQIESIYIGDGSYSTPIIDNANGQNNATNNGGIAVQGVSGKGAYFLNGKYADLGTDFQLNSDFTMSVWAKADNITTMLAGNIFVKATQFILRNGANFSNGDYLMLYLYDENGTNLTLAQGNIGALLPVNEWTHIVIVRSGTTLKSYRNGVLNKTIKLANATINKNSNPCSIANSNNTRPQTFDDLLIFDRALSDTEVLALYQNKANTPKYYTMSDYSIEQIDDDNVVDHLTEKPQLLSKWLEIYNAKNVSSALPTSNVSASGEYKGVIDSANEVGVIETDAVQAYITASNALRSALWGTNGYLVDMNKDSALSGSLDSLFSTYRQTLQKARTVISEQQASSASALTIVNSNPFCLIPVNAGGTVTTYENTGLRLQVFNGVTQLTPKASSATLSEGQWKVTANGSNITAGSQTVGNGYIDFGNVSALNADTAVITFTITALVNGVTNTLYTTQKFSKSKEGADGRIYTLLPDYTAVKKSADGSVLTPSSVTVQAKSWTGSSTPALYSSGDLKAFENDVQIGSTVSQGNTITVSPTGSYSVVIKLFVHGTNTLLDTLTIPVLQEVKGDTGRGLVSSVEKYKLSENLTEPFNESTASSWTDTASSVPTAQLPYLHRAVLQTYSEAPLNEYGDDVIIREYVTNGANGTSTRYSTATVTSSTESIALSTITGGTAVVGDVVIAGSMIFSVTAVGSTNATVQYKASIKGEDNKSITVIMSAPNVNVSCDSSGTPTGYANTPTTIRVYQNTQELSYDGSGISNGTWKATILSRSGCTGGSFTDSGVYATLSAITGMSSDNASRNISITGKRTDGTSFTTTVTQTLSKNKQGLQGGQGSRAIRYLGKSATKPNSSSQTSGVPTGLETPIQGDWYFCTTDGAVYYCSEISGTTYTWTVITWLDTTTVPDYRLTACLEDMLELSDQITTNQTMNNFIDKYINVLIANEAFINYLSTKTINFKNSVSSITKENVQVNDRMIYMGKNPLEEGDQEFRFGISRCRRIVGNHQDWTKDYFTDYLSTGIFGLHTSGIIQATDGIYANVGSEVQKESPIEALFTNMSASDGTYNFYVVPYGAEQGTKYAFKYSKDFIEWTTQIVDFDFDTYGTPTQVAYLNGNYIFTTSKNQSGSYLFYKTSIDGSFTKINTNMIGFYCAKIIYSKYTNNYYSVFSAETNSFVNCGKTLSEVVTVDENYKRIAGYVNDICMCVNNGTSYVIAVTGDESTHDNDGWVYRLGDADSFSSASYARLNANLRILAQTLYGAYPRLIEVASNDNGLVFAVGGIQGTNEQEPAMFKIDVSTVDSQYNRLFYKEECKFTNQGRIYSIASIGNSFIMGNSYGEIVHIDANGELKTYGVVDPRKGKGEYWGVSHINPLPHINAVVLSCIRYASATSTTKTGYAHFLSFGSELLNKPPRIRTSAPANPVDGDIWID